MIHANYIACMFWGFAKIFQEFHCDNRLCFTTKYKKIYRNNLGKNRGDWIWQKKPGEHLVFPVSHQISTNFIIYNEPVTAVIAHRKLAFCMTNKSSDKSPVVPQNPIRNNQSTIHLFLRVFICLHLYPFHIRLYIHLFHWRTQFCSLSPPTWQ